MISYVALPSVCAVDGAAGADVGVGAFSGGEAGFMSGTSAIDQKSAQ